MLQTFLLVLHILCGLSLIALILIQQGRGATTGAAFGSGASSTVFGARGSATFLSRATAILATVFFANCLLLAWLSTQAVAPKGLVERASTSAPAAPSMPTEVPAAPPQGPADMPAIPAQESPPAATTPAETKAAEKPASHAAEGAETDRTAADKAGAKKESAEQTAAKEKAAAETAAPAQSRSTDESVAPSERSAVDPNSKPTEPQTKQ